MLWLLCTKHYIVLACLQQALEVRVAQVMSFQHPGVCQFLHLLGDTASPPPIPGKPLQPWHRDGFSPPAAEFPLPVPTLTGFVICPQKCCPNLSFIPGKLQHTDLTPGLFHLASDPAPLTFSSFSMLACSPCFPWPSCHFHLLLVPAEPDLLWGQLGWMGTSGGHLVHGQRHSFIWKIPSHLTSKVTSSKY